MTIQCYIGNNELAYSSTMLACPTTIRIHSGSNAYPPFSRLRLGFGEATFHMVQKGPGIKNHLPQRNCGFKVVTHLGSNEVCRSLRTLTRWEVSYVGFGRYPGHPAQALQVRTKSDSIQKATRKPKWMGKRL